MVNWLLGSLLLLLTTFTVWLGYNEIPVQNNLVKASIAYERNNMEEMKVEIAKGIENCNRKLTIKGPRCEFFVKACDLYFKGDCDE